jgi:hypothetical protein
MNPSVKIASLSKRHGEQKPAATVQRLGWRFKFVSEGHLRPCGQSYPPRICFLQRAPYSRAEYLFTTWSRIHASRRCLALAFGTGLDLVWKRN